MNQKSSLREVASICLTGPDGEHATYCVAAQSRSLSARSGLEHHRYPIIAVAVLFQLKSGRTSAPRLPHALQMKRGSMSDSRMSSGQGAPMADFERLPVVVMAVLMVRGFAAACSTGPCCWWCRRCSCCSWCWCRLPSRHCPVTPQCAFISTAATGAGRGRLTLLVGGKAAVGSIKGEHTPRIILTARSSWKPVVEHDHANREERQSHSHTLLLVGALRPTCHAVRTSAPRWSQTLQTIRRIRSL
jgi:hypothetical protein